ncbi:MerR family transcriptional regulator [Nitrospiraceae bacterium HYJII51-Mn-bac16s-1-B09]|uniref:MerR family transcriptional regulator n=2 Tax=Candidatus Manganitrophus noduliformans TaxID=2606439 RepID=A0A7X6DQ49_9BACT|nr:MerR family transcriptional regulator [Candidatus Manganitrophus noduliformans]
MAGYLRNLGMLHKNNGKYKTKDICALFDISKATLFRWESEGRISNVGRDWRNWRLYSDQNIKEIKKIISRRSGHSNKQGFSKKG